MYRWQCNAWALKLATIPWRLWIGFWNYFGSNYPDYLVNFEIDLPFEILVRNMWLYKIMTWLSSRVDIFILPHQEVRSIWLP